MRQLLFSFSCTKEQNKQRDLTLERMDSDEHSRCVQLLSGQVSSIINKHRYHEDVWHFSFAYSLHQTTRDINLLPVNWSKEELQEQQQERRGVTWWRMWVTFKPSTLWLCGFCMDSWTRLAKHIKEICCDWTYRKGDFLSHYSKECKSFLAVNCGGLSKVQYLQIHGKAFFQLSRMSFYFLFWLQTHMAD